MKTNNFSHRALLSYICLPVLLAVSIPSSASIQLLTGSSMQTIAVINQQEADGEQEEATEEAKKPAAERTRPQKMKRGKNIVRQRAKTLSC